MLIPRYIFTNDFVDLRTLFEAQPHKEIKLKPGEYLWQPDEFVQSINYIDGGLTKTYLVHETGRRKIISYHGMGTIFPGFHELDFKIEQTLVTEAITPMKVWRFSREGFGRLLEEYPKLNRYLLNSYARYINLLLFETAHQEYNSGFVKICNAILLIHNAQTEVGENALFLSQEELSELVGMSRVNLTRHIGRLREEGVIDTARKQIRIRKLDTLMQYCSGETMPM